MNGRLAAVIYYNLLVFPLQLVASHGFSDCGQLRLEESVFPSSALDRFCFD
jgi:hypothetical protein